MLIDFQRFTNSPVNRSGLRLTLVSDRQNFDFQLAGTAAGLARLERCVRDGA